MTRLFPTRALRAAALTMMALFAAAPASAQDAGARVISNVARVSWEIGSERFERPSNRVEVPIEAVAASRASTYRLISGGTLRAPLSTTRCGPAGVAVPIAWGPAWPAGALDGTGLAPTASYRAGEPLVVIFEYPVGNRSAGVADTVDVVLRTVLGDAEHLTLTETGPDTGRFAAAIPTASAAAATAGNCRIEVRAGEVLAVTIHAGSGGATIAVADISYLADAAPDEPPAELALVKTASVAVAEPGDVIRYRVTVRNTGRVRSGEAVTLTDRLPPGFRLRAGSVRLDGAPLPTTSLDGGGFTATLPALAPGADAQVGYLVEVGSAARAGNALNRAQIFWRGLPGPVADALVRVTREVIAARMTITGRVTDGGCRVDRRSARGIGGVRVMLEDGSYAVTDIDGRYHFEGVEPGIHVVQLDATTLGRGRAPVDCARNTRGAGRAWSRFVEGGGGAHKRVDFVAGPAVDAAPPTISAPARPAIPSDAAAAGAERDHLAGETPGVGWLFPPADYNPRAPVTRVVVKHAPGQTVRLIVDGKPTDPLTADGGTKSADGLIAATRWRGVPLAGAATRIEAEVVNADGRTAATLTRTVRYTKSAMRAAVVPALSHLVADGVSRPVVAVRMTDRDGRPVHHGAIGEFTLPAPYLAAVEAEAQGARTLSGLERAQPFWRVDGDDGVAFIELEPTTASGTVAIDFGFRDGDVRREQRVEAWLDAGERPWTVVGFAAGTAGYNSLRRGIEALSPEDGKHAVRGRVALYAKGRVRGRWLLTAAFDSGKRRDDARFAGTIDPQAYYTIYADRSERRYDASSLRKLYLKLERPQFYALFGDYDTGLTDTELTRYARSLNGFKAEYGGPRLSATAFAADTPFTHRRDEIQGNGLSGPYALRARDVVPNSETIAIETRDRFRSNVIVETRRLTRHIDYDIDYFAGTLRFREPILSRHSSLSNSGGLDPQFIVADYEVDGVAGRAVNAGGRVAWRNAADTLRVGASAVRDADAGAGSTVLGGADVRVRPSAASEIRAEVAVSDGAGARPATAWLVEGELHGRTTDLLAYAREQESGFGVGQTNRAEDGSRKVGFDGRIRLGERLALSASGWHETYLDRDARRIAGRALIEYRTGATDLRAGLIVADDRLADGREAGSRIVQLGATRRLFANRLELDASSEFAIGGKDESIDFPTRHKLGGRFAVNDAVSLVGAYEVAKGDAIDARTLRVGFDLKPWAGARFAVTGNRQDIAEYGPRSFAAFGLSQSLAIGKRWTVDFSADGNRTVGGIDPRDVINPAHPVASGGFVGDGTLLTEDFTALTAGATYRGDRWSANARAEYRAGDRGDRYGVTAAMLRQVGEGSALGAAGSWTVAGLDGGPRSEARALSLSWAHRPAGSRWSWLERLDLRDDRVEDAVAGAAGPIGGAPLLITGDARSRRVVNSLSVNWSPVRENRSGWRDRAELSLFWGVRYASERFGADDVKGLSNMVGADLRFDLSDTLDVGVSGSVRHGLGARGLAWAVGPNVGVTPVANGWLSVGYNIGGFADRDYEGARYTRSGPYVTMRIKFDQLSLADLRRAVR